MNLTDAAEKIGKVRLAMKAAKLLTAGKSRRVIWERGSKYVNCYGPPDGPPLYKWISIVVTGSPVSNEAEDVIAAVTFDDATEDQVTAFLTALDANDWLSDGGAS